MNHILNSSLTKYSKRDELLDKDRWQVEELGIAPNTTHSSYYLDFSHIQQAWLKQAAKRFVRFQSATKSDSSCRSYIAALTRFSNYLCDISDQTTPNIVTRELMINFFTYLAEKKFGVVTRRTTIIHIRTFHQIMLQENWLPWPEKPLIYSSDIPKEIISYPRYIPEGVIIQLQQSLHHLQPYLQRFIKILLETGRRISEICTLPYECLEQDSQNDWYMRVCESKLKRIRLIPISQRCVQAVQEQQHEITIFGKKSQHLFPARRRSKSGHISARYLHQALT